MTVEPLKTSSGKPEDQAHYNALAVQPLELMKAILTPEEYRGFLKGNCIKYALRAGHKQGESVQKDLEKFEAYSAFLYESYAD